MGFSATARALQHAQSSCGIGHALVVSANNLLFHASATIVMGLVYRSSASDCVSVYANQHALLQLHFNPQTVQARSCEHLTQTQQPYNVNMCSRAHICAPRSSCALFVFALLKPRS